MALQLTYTWGRFRSSSKTSHPFWSVLIISLSDWAQRQSVANAEPNTADQLTYQLGLKSQFTSLFCPTCHSPEITRPISFQDPRPLVAQPSGSVIWYSWSGNQSNTRTRVCFESCRAVLGSWNSRGLNCFPSFCLGLLSFSELDYFGSVKVQSLRPKTSILFRSVSSIKSATEEDEERIN